MQRSKYHLPRHHQILSGFSWTHNSLGSAHNREKAAPLCQVRAWIPSPGELLARGQWGLGHTKDTHQPLCLKSNGLLPGDPRKELDFRLCPLNRKLTPEVSRKL